MTIFENLSDLQNWVRERCDCQTSDDDVDAIVDEIKQDRDRPGWGADWTIYLEALPTPLESMLT